MSKLISILFYFTFLFNFQYCFGQGICTYKNSTGFESETIKLLDSNKFEFRFSSCTGRNKKEYGTYSFDEKELNLRFNDTVLPSQKESIIMSMESKPSHSSKTKMKFKIVSDWDNQPLEFATVQIYSNDKLTCSSHTDSLGETLLIFESTNQDLRIKISYSGHQTFDLPLKLENRDYNITIILSERSDRKMHKNGELVRYIIARETKESIELSTDGREFRSYKISCR